MIFNSDRFGALTIDPKDLIEFPAGLIGFPNDNTFILLRQREGSPIAWLHSTTNPSLAFPVISLEALSVEYPEADILRAAEVSGISGSLDSFSVMLVFAAPGKDIPPTVNLVAPIVVNAETRSGAQILLEGTRLSACEPLSTWLAEPAPQPQPAARARRTTEVQIAMDEP